jgi:nucleotide-binding universal stress UspA family protein
MSEAVAATVLCAVDDSKHAPAVAFVAAGLAEHLNARLVVLRLDPRAGGTAEEKADARRELSEFMMEGLPGGVGYREGTESRLADGPPAESVLREALHLVAGLIVLGTRGRGSLTRAILGSTALSVLKGGTWSRASRTESSARTSSIACR